MLNLRYCFIGLGTLLLFNSCQTSFVGLTPSKQLGMSFSQRSASNSAASSRSISSGGSSGILVGAGQSAVNSDYVSVNGTGTEGIFQYTKDDRLAPTNLNICFYGMAALMTDPDDPTKMKAADHATLVNNGTIEMSYHDFVERYKSQTKISTSGTELYDNMMGWGMLVGDYSTAINNGTITMYYNEDPSYGYPVFSHPIYIGENSSMINNGEINILGNGSYGSQVRGLTSSHHNIKIENNGILNIDIDNAYMARALATTGRGSTLTNNGSIYLKTSSVAYGFSQNGGCTNLNNGIVEVITKGYTPQNVVPGIFPAFNACAYGFGDIGPGGFNENRGVVKARVMGDAETDPYSCAHGMFFLGTQKVDGDTRHISNVGLIEVSSTVLPGEGNNYQHLTSEVGINTSYIHSDTDNKLTVKVGKWATTLRDFATTKDLFNGRNGVYDLSEAELIFRPSDDYTAGTQYDVSQSALVHNLVFANSEHNDLDVVGYENIKFSTEMPEFLSVNVTTDKKASLVLNNDKESVKSMIGNVVMGNVDFTRNMMNIVDNTLRTDTVGAFVIPYVSNISREQGINNHVYGILAGGSWKLNDAWKLGLHGSYGRAEGNGDFYGARGRMNGWQAGLHAQYNLSDNLYVKGQASGFLNSDENCYSVNHTGVTLQGKSENKVRGFYASIAAGNKFRINEGSDIQLEMGASSLNMYHLPVVDWNLLGTAIEGYQMGFGDKYRAVFMNGLVSWNHRIQLGESCHQFSVGGGIRGKLFADDIEMNMLNDTFSHTLSEDNQTGVVRLSYTWNKNGYHWGGEYYGNFGKRMSSSLFAFTAGLSF